VVASNQPVSQFFVHTRSAREIHDVLSGQEAERCLDQAVRRLRRVGGSSQEQRKKYDPRWPWDGNTALFWRGRQEGFYSVPKVPTAKRERTHSRNKLEGVNKRYRAKSVSATRSGSPISCAASLSGLVGDAEGPVANSPGGLLSVTNQNGKK
jgi:hypothetical protein